MFILSVSPCSSVSFVFRPSSSFLLHLHIFYFPCSVQFRFRFRPISISNSYLYLYLPPCRPSSPLYPTPTLKVRYCYCLTAAAARKGELTSDISPGLTGGNVELKLKSLFNSKHSEIWNWLHAECVTSQVHRHRTHKRGGISIRLCLWRWREQANTRKIVVLISCVPRKWEMGGRVKALSHTQNRNLRRLLKVKVKIKRTGNGNAYVLRARMGDGFDSEQMHLA